MRPLFTVCGLTRRVSNSSLTDFIKKRQGELAVAPASTKMQRPVTFFVLDERFDIGDFMLSYSH